MGGGGRLTQAGLLREITGKARNRVYRADEVLQAIDEPLTSLEDDWLNDSEEQMQFIGNTSAA